MSLSFEEKQLWVAILAVNGIGRKSLRRILKQLNDLNVSLRDFWQQKPTQIWQLCGLNSRQQQGLKNFKKFIISRYNLFLSSSSNFNFLPAWEKP